MPGIIVMNHSASDAAAASRDGDIKKRAHDGRLTNGASMVVATPKGPTPEQYSDEPPEIEHVGDEQYNSLSTLLMRVSQESYNDMGALLQNMADIPVGPASNGSFANGLIAANSQGNAEANKRKKLLLLQFAQEQRAKFIKLLVLTEWGKKAAKDLTKLIDLFRWASEQAQYMEAADFKLDRIKVQSNNARENSPDIATALEVLSSGTASWMPSLGYVPPEPISSEQALKLLRYMNTSLSIRLNVHENLPRHLQNWRIHSGRVTFVIDNELEFHVMSFVEDASEQWFLIDLRLLFTPAPIITVGSRFFMQLKLQADFILKDKGLSGLFDFLNNFILTHKISVLRSQAVALVRAGWAGSLKVEPVHRLLVVSYWTNRPGKKNWIEIGISSNRPKNGNISWRGQPIPSLTTRWFRQGKEVKDANFKFDWKNLSMEKVIKLVIARHTSDILCCTKDKLKSGVMADAHLSGTEPADCTLSATLGTKSASLTLSLEPVTGNFIMRPASALSARAENAFNQGREPEKMADIITQVLAGTLHSLIQKIAQQLGWQVVAKRSLRPQVVTAAVNSDVISFTLFCPRGWSSSGWALAAIIDSSGESWWVFEIGPTGDRIRTAEQIKLDRPDGSSLPIDRKNLASLDRIAVQLISFRATASRLVKERNTCSLQSELGQVGGTESRRIARRWVMHLQSSDLLVEAPGQDAWLEPDIKVTCEGLIVQGQTVWHIAAGKMVEGVAADMHKLMAASPQSTFKFSEDGNFRILLSTPFGQDILGELRSRLRDVNRLRTFAATLQKRQMRLGSSSLQRVHFQYGPSPYSATVNFSSEQEFSIELSPKNPHRRILKLLTAIANDQLPSLPTLDSNDTNGLDRFCTTLVLTRPLFKVLWQIEERTPGNYSNPAIHVHSILKYRLTYSNPVCTFDIRLQHKADKVFWVLEDNLRPKDPNMLPTPERGQGHRRLDTLQVKLKALFSEKGVGWFGTRNGMVAELDAIPDAIRKLDDCVLGCKMDGGYVAPPQQAQNQGHGLSQALAQTAGPQQTNQLQQQQQARMQQQQQLQQQQQQQQARQQQQAQHNQQQVRRQQPPQQQSQRGQQPNGRPNQQHMPNGRQQMLQQQHSRGVRPGQNQNNVIEID